MTAWTDDELDRIGAADELEITTLRRDGTPRKPVTIWVVRCGDGLYVRAGLGRESAWFRGTQACRTGHIEAAGVAADVAFEGVDPSLYEPIDAAYAAKYLRYGQEWIDMLVAPLGRSTTTRLVRRR
jgi:hypothetical protein